MSEDEDEPTAEVVRFPGGKRGYTITHPPFEPGNEMAVKHGAYSPRIVDPLATELVEQVLSDPDAALTHAPRFRYSLWAWAKAETQVQLVSEYLAEKAAAAGNGVGDLKDERVLSAYLLLHRAEARAARERSRLGLDPLSASKLNRDRAAAAVDAAQLFAELRRLEAEGVTIT